MLKDFPLSYKEAIDWGWEEFEPYAQELLARAISPDDLSQWLADESQFLGLIHELNGRLAVAVDQNNDNPVAKDRRDRFREQVWTKTRHLMIQLERKLIDTNLIPPNYDIQLERIHTDLEIFHPDNVDLETEEKSYRDRYENIYRNIKIGVQGENHSVFAVLGMLHREPDRVKRELIYKNILAARLPFKEDYDALWVKLFSLRQQIARNAGVSDYRSYMWKKLNRHDYTPLDVMTFCDAIENVIVPMVASLQGQQAIAMGTDRLKPWDKTVTSQADSIQKPYRDTQDWLQKSRTVFHNISPAFAAHFDTMQAEGLMDLESRPNKSPWNYSEWLPASSRTFIFINGRGGVNDLFLLFHEFGHAVQMIEMSPLPYMRQKMLPDEISEVASTTMELLASDHLRVFYTEEQAEIVRRNYLISMLNRLTSAATVALFQHWAYTNPDGGADPDACDQYWLSLCDRFMPGIDYTGFEDDLLMQWREVFQVFVFPFYYIEYAFAQLGAVQIWQNYHRASQISVEQFRHALSRGHTVNVPEFYNLAGVKFAVDTETLRTAMGPVEKVLKK